MFRTGFRKLKDLFSAMNGGEPMSDQWTSDTQLRAAIRNSQPNDIRTTEGGLFLDDLREFLQGLDDYNKRRNPRYQFNLVVHKDIADTLVQKLTSGKVSAFGVSRVGGLGLERNGRVYAGEYFNDHVYSTGFIFRTNNSEGRFFCGVPGKERADFSKFAEKLLTVPVYYPAPSWVR